MQSYTEYWQTKRTVAETSSRARSEHGGKTCLIHSRSRSADPQQIPFDPTRLPVIARTRIRRPVTPPPTPSRSVTATSVGSSTPVPPPTPISSPTPVRVSRCYLPTPTPSLVTPSTQPSSPNGSVLLTPVTPPLYHWPNDNCGDLETPESPTPYAPMAKLAFWDTAVHAAQRSLLPNAERLTAVEKNFELPELDVSEPPSPILLCHTPSDGGAVAALKRYDRSLRLDPGLSGMSLFLNCPKRRVPFPSDEQLERQDKVARDWAKLRNVAGQWSSLRLVQVELEAEEGRSGRAQADAHDGSRRSRDEPRLERQVRPSPMGPSSNG